MLMGPESNLVGTTHHGRTTGGANRRRNIGAVELNSRSSDRIDIRCSQLIGFVAVAAHPGRCVFRKDPDDVRTVFCECCRESH